MEDPAAPQAELAALRAQVAALTQIVSDQGQMLREILALVHDVRNRGDWNNVQIAQLLKVIAAGVREVRETQVYSLVAEGPVSVTDLRQLQTVSRDHLELNLVHPNEDHPLKTA